MVRIPVTLGQKKCDILIGRDAWQQLDKYAERYDRVVVITDRNVGRLYGDRIAFPKIVTEPGETSKSWASAEKVIQEMLALGLTRSSAVIALGGGVVGDLAGFCAAIYMRGIPYIQVPTTLLAQIDSAIGGKTAIDLPAGKNLVGAFHQPEVVLINPEVLQTLSRADLVSGLGEVVKYAVMAAPELLDILRAGGEMIFTAPHESLSQIIVRCCTIKAEIVSADEWDQGLRKQLNAGHTIGHALETATSFRAFTHGEAVLFGLAAEARLSYRLGLLDRQQLAEIEGACQLIGLPVVPSDLSLAEVKQALLRDKKNRADRISFMLPRAMGQVEEVLLSIDEVERHLEAVLYPGKV